MCVVLRAGKCLQDTARPGFRGDGALEQRGGRVWIAVAEQLEPPLVPLIDTAVRLTRVDHPAPPPWRPVPGRVRAAEPAPGGLRHRLPAGALLGSTRAPDVVGCPASCRNG